MTNTKCKSQDPYFCRFHSKRAYEDSIKNLAYWEDKVSQTTNVESSIYVHKKIEEYSAQRDASAVGFKKLSKEFNQALKHGSVQQQAEIASRLKKAADLRLEEGTVGEWENPSQDIGFLGKKVLEKSKHSNVVELPYELTGAQDIGYAYDHLKSKGYKVTKLEVYPFMPNAVDTPEEHERVHQKALQLADSLGGTNVYQHIEKDGYAFRGLSFIGENGKEVTVREEPRKPRITL